VKYIKTSAKTGVSVDKLYNKLSKLSLKMREKKKEKIEIEIILKNKCIAFSLKYYRVQIEESYKWEGEENESR
jgi:hypothetical protein